MKKIFSLLALVLLVVLFYFYFFPKQPNNIFDEIYQETEKTYHTNNILRNIDGLKSVQVGQVMTQIYLILLLESMKLFPKAIVI